MKIISTIFLMVLTTVVSAQGLESVELKASDLVSGHAENDLIALAESARLARKPVIVMAPDSWRQQIAGMLRKAWPQIQLKLKKSPSGKMKAYLQPSAQAATGKALAPEVEFQHSKPAAEFEVEPMAQTHIQSVQAISAQELKGPGLLPLSKPVVQVRRDSTPSSGSKLRPGTGSLAEKSDAGQQENRAAKQDKPLKTRSRKFVSEQQQATSTHAARVTTGQGGRHPAPEDKSTASSMADPVQAEQRKLEKIYNKGKRVKKSLTIRKLKLHDVLYIWEHNTLVVRKSSSTKRHFWLQDWKNLDLDQPAIRSEGNHLYRVIGRIQN